jgi:periplasmic protein CpxP/Spy
MTPQTHFRTLWAAVAGLFLLNLGLIGWIALGSRGGGPPRRIDFAGELKFDETQRQRFDRLITQHFAEVTPLRDSIDQLKADLLVATQTPDISPGQVRWLADELARNVARNEATTYLHFRDVRALCHPDQLPGFDRLLEENLRRKGPPKGPR